MSTKKSGRAAVLWVLAALLLTAVLVSLALGLRAIRRAGEGTSWHLQAGPMTVTPVNGEGLESPGAGRSYYKVEFELTNNSVRELRTDYSFAAKPQKAQRYAIRVLAVGGDAEYEPVMVTPPGCTGRITLYLSVMEEQLDSRSVDIIFDDYRAPQTLGTVVLP